MKLVVNTILLSFFYILILAMGFAAFKVTGPDQPPVGLWIGMVVFFIVCCIPLWIWRSRLKRNQEKVSIIRSPILWWKSQPVYSNFLLILVPGLFILVFIMVGFAWFILFSVYHSWFRHNRASKWDSCVPPCCLCGGICFVPILGFTCEKKTS